MDSDSSGPRVELYVYNNQDTGKTNGSWLPKQMLYRSADAFGVPLHIGAVAPAAEKPLGRLRFLKWQVSRLKLKRLRVAVCRSAVLLVV